MVDTGGVIAGQVHRDGRHRGDRARQPDQRPGLPDWYRGGHHVQGRVDIGDGGGQLGCGRRVTVEMPLGHPDTADIDG